MAQGGNPKRVSLVFPIILITIGALFLFRNWRPGFDPVPILWTYWPLMLILIGVGKIRDKLQRGRNHDEPPGESVGAAIETIALVGVLLGLHWHCAVSSRRYGLMPRF